MQEGKELKLKLEKRTSNDDENVCDGCCFYDGCDCSIPDRRDHDFAFDCGKAEDGLIWVVKS